MKNNKKYNDLLSEGFSEKTLSSLTEKQVNILHKRIFSEATYRVAADKVDSIKDKVSDTDTVEVTEEDEDSIEEELNEEPDYSKPVSPDKGWNQDVRSKNVSDNRVDKSDGTMNSVKFVEKGKQAKEVSKSGHTGFAQPNKKVNIGGKKSGSKSTSGSSMSESRTSKKDIINFISEITKIPTLSLKSKTDDMPDFMDFDLFDGKVADLMGNSPVETPVKPTTKPGTKPGKPIIKPKHSPKPKAQMEEGLNQTDDLPDFMSLDVFAGKGEDVVDNSPVETPVKPTTKPGTKPGKPIIKPKHSPKPKAGIGEESELEENGRTFAGGDEKKGGLPKQRGSKHPEMKK